MKRTVKYALAAMIAGGAAVAATAPAQAGVGFSIQVGPGGYGGYGGYAGYGGYYGDYYGYNYGRPCVFYFRHALPAPARCYRDYYGYYGPGVYLSDGFVFSNRGNYGHWHDNDRFRHWRSHNWSADRSYGGNAWSADRHSGGGNDGRHNDGGGHDWNASRDSQNNGGGHDSRGSNDWQDGGNRDRGDYGQH